MRTSRLNSTGKLLRQNVRIVKRLCAGITQGSLATLRDLTETLRLSVSRGELLCLDGKWYVTHAGLLRIAQRSRCSGIRTQLEERLSDPAASRWVFKAIVYKFAGSKGFVGYGDADPSNVSSLVHGAEMRVAETRAVNRALRKAYGIGLCSVEELGSFRPSLESAPGGQKGLALAGESVPGNGQPRLRDRLCQLIRQHNLDPNLVKRYAADYCKTDHLRDASREQIEVFINNLAEQAAKDREGLVCLLNSYAQPQEAKS